MSNSSYVSIYPDSLMFSFGCRRGNKDYDTDRLFTPEALYTHVRRYVFTNKRLLLRHNYGNPCRSEHLTHHCFLIFLHEEYRTIVTDSLFYLFRLSMIRSNDTLGEEDRVGGRILSEGLGGGFRRKRDIKCGPGTGIIGQVISTYTDQGPQDENTGIFRKEICRDEKYERKSEVHFERL